MLSLCLSFGMGLSACSQPAETTESAPNQQSDGLVTSSEPETVQSEGWKVATWNVEHLAFPPTNGCKPRTVAELAGLKAYAENLDADIVALQEVASVAAVEQLFPSSEWQIFMSDRPDSNPYECRESGFTSTQQKVGYAVRNGIPVVGAESLDEFGLEMPGLRYGMELTVTSPFGDMTLLNLHMKSGCFVDNYSRADSDACQVFSEQAPILDNWIEQREKAGQPYVMLGDLNHRLSAPYNHLTRQLATNTDGSESTLINTTAPLISCHPYYPAPIDHIFVGHLDPKAVDLTAATVEFEDMASADAMLSDHCAMILTLTKTQQ